MRSDSFMAGLGALPIELARFGAPGCRVLCDLVATDFRVHSGGSMTYGSVMPGGAAAIGLVLFQQAYVFYASANPLGVTSSRAGRAVLQ